MITWKHILIILGVLILLFIIIEIIIKTKTKFKYKYRKKQCIMTNTELKYYSAILNILQGTQYILLPQIPLSAIVERYDNHTYQSELSRVADFVIFSRELAPLLVIEINDSTHLRKDRKERDEKVKFILKSAKLPLLTIWTNKPFDIAKIKKDIEDFGIKTYYEIK